MVDYREYEPFFSRRIYKAIFLTGEDIRDEYLHEACIVIYWNLTADFLAHDDASAGTEKFPEPVRRHFKIERLPDAHPHHRLQGNFFYHEAYVGEVIQYRLYLRYAHSLYNNGIVKEFRQIPDHMALLNFDEAIPEFLHWAQYLIDKERCIFKMSLMVVSAAQKYAKKVLKSFRYTIYPHERCPMIRVKMKRDYVLTAELPMDRINETIDGLPFLIRHPLLIRKAGDNYHLDKGDYKDGMPGWAGAYYDD